MTDLATSIAKQLQLVTAVRDRTTDPTVRLMYELYIELIPGLLKWKHEQLARGTTSTPYAYAMSSVAGMLASQAIVDILENAADKQAVKKVRVAIIRQFKKSLDAHIEIKTPDIANEIMELN